MRKPRIVSVTSVLSLLALAGVFGCGGGVSDAPNLAPAGGTVTYNGEPAAWAMVTFAPEKGPAASGQADATGTFTLMTGSEPGAVIGPGVFLVRSGTEPTAAPAAPTEGPPPNTTEMMQKMAEAQRSEGKRPTAEQSQLPAKYATAATSTLIFTIDADQTKNNFALELKD